MQDRDVEITLALIGVFIGLASFFISVVGILTHIALAPESKQTTPYKFAVYGIVMGLLFAVVGTLYLISKGVSLTNSNWNAPQANVQTNSNSPKINKTPNPSPTSTPRASPIPSPSPSQTITADGTPFRIVLSESDYCFKGVIAGVYRVTPNSIDITITGPDIKLCLDSDHPRRTLVSFKIGVSDMRYANPSTNVRWSSLQKVNKEMIAGGGPYSINPRSLSIERSDTQLPHVIYIELGFTWNGRAKPLYVVAHS